MRFFNFNKDRIKLILGFRVSGKYVNIRESDIFLVSYPKSGNTWLRFLFGNVVSNEEVGFHNINNIIPDIYKTLKKDIEKISSNRIIKSHESYTPKYPKVIYIYRDPRDVVISYFYWYKKFKKKKELKFDDFFEQFIDGNVSHGLWSEHVKGWLEASKSHPDNIYFLNYQDLKNNTYVEFKKVLEFCNFKCSDEKINKAVNLSDFEKMKELEKKQEKKSFLKGTDLSIKFVRSGKSEWKDILSEKQQKQLYNRFKNVIEEIEIR